MSNFIPNETILVDDRDPPWMQSALEYQNTYLTDKNDELFLTIDSFITLNNIITYS